jgi:hypothetical protein
MLSWSSSETSRDIDLLAVTNDDRDPGLAGGRRLLAFATAILTGEPSDVAAARDAVAAALGPEAVVDAAAVVGNFEMMNRIADAVGMPVGRGTRTRMHPTITALGLDRFPHALITDGRRAADEAATRSVDPSI